MKTLVTGATGFIGSHLVERLLSKGHKVTCITRNVSDPGWLKDLDVSLIQGDCTDRGFLRDKVNGYDYIFHLSGLTKTSRNKEFYTVNTYATENIISAIAEENTGIKKFIYLSSLSAFGPKRYDSLPTETEEPNPVSAYGISKLDAERAILKYSNTVPISILRPSAVYGPRDREILLIFKFIKKGILPHWGDGFTSIIYIDDLIDAVMLAVEKDLATGEIYFISDGRVYSNREILNEIASALNSNPLKIKLPGGILRMIGFFSERISKIMGKNTMINRDKIKELSHAVWACDITKAKKDLCFNPKVGLKEGIRWTADWYRIHKWI
jgi:nucleoside-diphosphate-sugar epimerase